VRYSCGPVPLDAPVCGDCHRGDAARATCRDERWLQQERLVSIGKLAAEVAHDFNNLVTAILGFAHLALADLEDDGRTAADLREIVTAGETAATLAGQLLSLAKPSPHRNAATDVGEVCQDVGRMLGRVIGRGIELSVVIPPVPARVLIERHRLEQVVVNLVLNARDAMPEGGRVSLSCDTVDLATRRSASPRRYVRLRVSDTGRGIPPEVLPDIFEPFFTTKSSQGGTGLGLASCHQIISEAGGEIAVSSSSGVGTEFTIVLPPATQDLESHGDGAEKAV
jgi:two-component system cell cycle sensor histidine kinase/response regulator CckA